MAVRKVKEKPSQDDVIAWHCTFAEAKKAYNNYRDLLFEYLDEWAEGQGLLDEIQVESESREAVLANYPAYDIIKETKDGFYSLRRNPSTVGGRLIHPELGMSVGRDDRSPKDQLNIAEFKERYPEFAAQVIDRTYTCSGSLVDQIIEEVPELEDEFTLSSETLNQSRVDELAGEDPMIIAAISECEYPVLPGARLASPKKEKIEE